MRAAVALALVAAGTVGCGAPESLPLGQVLLAIDTDAPLRPPPGASLAPDEPLPLFDRLRVDVADPRGDGCEQCSRELDLFASPEPLSFGVLLPPGEAGFTARVRMFRSVPGTIEPRPDSSLEITVALPAVAEEGIVHASVFLRTDDVGKPIGSADAPEQAGPALSGPSQQGSWALARRTPCAGAARPGEACVRGGAFWMGQPALALAGATEGLVSMRRLVVLSPFWVDTRETTVGAARPYLQGLSEDERQGAIAVWSGATSGDVEADWCSYADDPARDALPMNCITWSAAQKFCDSERGGMLPSEAEFEYLASGFVSDLYVWGPDDPDCDDATFARGGIGVYDGHANGYCRPDGAAGGPMPAGAGARDVLQLEDGAVLDLGGNVREWMRDRFQSEAQGCLPPGVLVDPTCAPADPASSERSVRGGGWASVASQLRAATRGLAHSGALDPALGFRCVRAATQP